MNDEESSVHRNKLPKKICILDIETYGINRKRKEETKLAFCGIKLYKLNANSYRGLKHKVFFPEQTGELETFLKNFDGIIIGHRLFDFDYRVLSSVICLKGVIEKSADTRFTLRSHIDCRGPRWSFFNAGLDRICKLNFNLQKTLDPKNLVKLLYEADFHLHPERFKPKFSEEILAAATKLLTKFRPKKSERETLVCLRVQENRLVRTTFKKGFPVYVPRKGKLQLVKITDSFPNPKKGLKILQKLIEYNHGDCCMTHRLWWSLVRRKKIKVPCSILTLNEEQIDNEKATPRRHESLVNYSMDSIDVSQLVCNKPVFTHDAWRKRLQEFGDIEQKRRKIIYREGYELSSRACPNCGKYSLSQFDKITQELEDEKCLAENFIGNWGTVICSICSSSFHFRDDA